MKRELIRWGILIGLFCVLQYQINNNSKQIYFQKLHGDWLKSYCDHNHLPESKPEEEIEND